MTRLAIISDVHADVHAVQDALARIDRMGCDLVVCAGDIVDYGLFPEETIALLRERGVPCIRGNHDRWAVGRGRADAPDDTGVPVHDASGFDLSYDAVKFLAGLPARWDAVPDGVRVAARHGTPKSDMEGIDPRRATGLDARRWLADAEADVLVVGHTHIAFAFQVAGGGLIVNPGALLRDPAHRSEPGAMLFDPDTGKSVPMPPLEGGTFGVLELPAKTFTVYRAADGAEVDILRIDAPEPRPTQ